MSGELFPPSLPPLSLLLSPKGKKQKGFLRAVKMPDGWVDRPFHGALAKMVLLPDPTPSCPMNLHDRLTQLVCNLHAEALGLPLSHYEASKLINKFKGKNALLWVHLSEEYSPALSAKYEAQWEEVKRSLESYTASINNRHSGGTGGCADGCVTIHPSLTCFPTVFLVARRLPHSHHPPFSPSLSPW